MKIRYRTILRILVGLIFISFTLVMQMKGINYKPNSNNSKMLLNKNQVTRNKIKPNTIDTVIIYNSKDEYSTKEKDFYNIILKDMRIGYSIKDLQKDTIHLEDYKRVIFSFFDTSLVTNYEERIKDYIKDGGQLLIGGTPSPATKTYQEILGIEELDSQYISIEDFKSESSFMLGAKKKYVISDPSPVSLNVNLKDSTHVYAKSSKNEPIIWTNQYGKGKVAFYNLTYFGNAYRGLAASAFSLLGDYTIYPVINSSTFYLDDFPAPVPGGEAKYIQRDYHLSISNFMSNVWWPDVLSLSKKHNIPFTGLIIEDYNNKTNGALKKQSVTYNFHYYGNLLLRNNGEIGVHGYNHQPLALSNFNYQTVKYHTWESMSTMRKAVNELYRFSSKMFPGSKINVYVPPSNILSKEGRELLGKTGKVKVIASTYAPSGEAYAQEYEIGNDGVVETPRIVSGGNMDDYSYMLAFSEMNMHYVSSHFMHPDDVLDVDRGAKLGWKKLSQNVDKYMSWVDESGKYIRHLSGSNMGGAVQRFANVTPQITEDNNEVKVHLDGFIDESYLFIRLNDKKITDVQGGSIKKLNDTLYLLHATQSDVTIRGL